MNSALAFEGIAYGLYSEEAYRDIMKALSDLSENKSPEGLLAFGR